MRTQVLYEQAESHLRHGQWQLAAQLFEQVLEILRVPCAAYGKGGESLCRFDGHSREFRVMLMEQCAVEIRDQKLWQVPQFSMQQSV